MISFEEARAIVESFLPELPDEDTGKLRLIDEATIERDFGWVFFWNTTAFLDEGDDFARLGGNAPIIIDWRDGSLHLTGTGEPTEQYIQNYEKFGTPYPPANG